MVWENPFLGKGINTRETLKAGLMPDKILVKVFLFAAAETVLKVP